MLSTTLTHFVVPPVLPNCFQSDVIGSLHSKYPCSKHLVIYPRLGGSEESTVQDRVHTEHAKVMDDLEKVKSEIKALEEKQLALQCDAQLTTALQCHFESNSAELAHLGNNWCAKFEETQCTGSLACLDRAAAASADSHGSQHTYSEAPRGDEVLV